MGKIIFTTTMGNVTLGEELPPVALWITLAISLAVFITFYVLRSIGIYTLAVKNGVKNPKLAWVPALWIIPATQIVGEYKFFGKKFNSFAVAFGVIFAVTLVALLTYNFLIYFPAIGYYLQGGDLYMGTNVVDIVANPNDVVLYWTGEFYVGANIIYPYSSPNLVAKIIDYIGMGCDVLDLIILIIQINVFIALFKRYIPQHFILFSVLSVMGIFGPLVFAVRNNQCIEDVIKNRQNRYGAYGNPYGNPYGNQYGNPYGNPYNNQNNNYGNPYANQGAQRPNSQQDPFEEFNDEPFEEFFNKKDNGDKR